MQSVCVGFHCICKTLKAKHEINAAWHVVSRLMERFWIDVLIKMDVYF